MTFLSLFTKVFALCCEGPARQSIEMHFVEAVTEIFF